MGRRTKATKAWLSRGKIWDDVFTRTVSILISTAIVTPVLAWAKIIHIDRRGWAVIVAVAGAIILFPLPAVLQSALPALQSRILSLYRHPDDIRWLIRPLVGILYPLILIGYIIGVISAYLALRGQLGDLFKGFEFSLHRLLP